MGVDPETRICTRAVGVCHSRAVWERDECSRESGELSGVSTHSPSSTRPPTALDLRIEVVRAGAGLGCVRAIGELDFSTASRLRRVLLAEVTLLVREPAARTPHLELDLSGVRFCAAAGLAVLLEARADAIGAGVGFTLSRTSTAVERVLVLGGLGQALPAAPTIPGPRQRGRT